MWRKVAAQLFLLCVLAGGLAWLGTHQAEVEDWVAREQHSRVLRAAYAEHNENSVVGSVVAFEWEVRHGDEKTVTRVKVAYQITAARAKTAGIEQEDYHRLLAESVVEVLRQAVHHGDLVQLLVVQEVTKEPRSGNTVYEIGEMYDFWASDITEFSWDGEFVTFAQWISKYANGNLAIARFFLGQRVYLDDPDMIWVEG